MKFDIVVGNPPYGKATHGNLDIHFKILKTSLDFCVNKLCFIMPGKALQTNIKPIYLNVLKNAVCVKAELQDKNIFKNTNMQETAIYYCDRNANPDDYDKKLDVDANLYNNLDDICKLFIDKMSTMKELEIYKTYTHSNIKEEMDKMINSVIKSLSDDYYYLNVNRANGALGAKWISPVLEKEGIKTKDEEIEYITTYTAKKNILKCPSLKYGENLKKLMIDGKVLRLSLWLMQENQDMYQKVFKYVPDIDYTTIDTDEKLLSACGFTSDEIVKVMKYLNDFDFSKNRNDFVRESDVEDQSSSPSTSESLPKTIYGLDREKLDPSSDIPKDEKYDEEDLKKAYQ